MLRSVFGAIVNDARKFPEGPGFGFSRNTRPLVERVDFGLERLLLQIKHAPSGFVESLDQIRLGVSDISDLLKELVDNPIKGSLFFQRNPEMEINRMVDLLFAAKFENSIVPLVAPVCPDYLGNYRLGDGVGKTAEKVLKTHPHIQKLFHKYGFATQLRIDVANVEAFDDNILRISGETTESFLSKTLLTRSAIESRVASSGDVQVTTMCSLFEENRFDYLRTTARNAHEIISACDGVKARVRDQLINERKRVGDLELVDQSQIATLISFELGGYAAYGEFVGGRAVILSPDAMSAVPAYHFGVFRPNEYSPVIFIQK